MTIEGTTQEVSYELVLLQFRADVTSEELLNIGVVAFSPETQELACKTTTRSSRVRAVFPSVDGAAFRELSRSIQHRAKSIGKEFRKYQSTIWAPNLSVGDEVPWTERQHIEPVLRRIVAPGSPNFVWSSIRYGVCTDLTTRVAEVFEEYIGRAEASSRRDRVDSKDLWRAVTENPVVKPVIEGIQRPVVLKADTFSYTFRASWMNGHLQVVEPISFDFVKAAEMQDIALLWNGIINVLSSTSRFSLTAVITDRPSGAAADRYDEATSLLARNENVRDVIPLSAIDRLNTIVEHDLAAD